MIVYEPFELHCHTVHSDGDFTVEELMRAAVNFGLKGIALTDHNTMSGWEEASVLTDKYLYTVPGIEWTTYYGHMLVLGAEKYVDWRFVKPDTIDSSLRQIHDCSGVIGIAHPFSMGGPLYTGGHWEFHVRAWEYVNYIEVWHKGRNETRTENRRAVEWYDGLLNAGKHLGCTAGRDWHRPDPEEYLCALTYVGLQDDIFDTAHVREALRMGRTYLTFGPCIDLRVQQGDGMYGIGDTVQEGKAFVHVRTGLIARREIYGKYHLDLQTVRIIQNGIPVREQPWEDVLCIPIRLKPGWLRLEIAGTYEGSAGEETLVMTSPVYVNPYR